MAFLPRPVDLLYSFFLVSWLSLLLHQHHHDSIAAAAAQQICRPGGTQNCHGGGGGGGGRTGDPRAPCTGAHCPGGGRSSRSAAAVPVARQQYNINNPTTGSSSGATQQHVRAAQIVASQHRQVHPAGGSRSAPPPITPRERDHQGARMIMMRTPEGPPPPPPGCTGGTDCVQKPQPINDTLRDCKGIECKLPALRIRLNKQQTPRPKSSSSSSSCGGGGEGCAGSSLEDSPPLSPPVHLADRAAQFLGDFPEFGSYPSSEFGGGGGAPLGVQLTCDIKPGENEVPSEDALILHLQLAKGQEKLVEALRAQQTVIRDLQQKLVEQQGALLAQQREILEQQRRAYEQMDVVKAQYGLLSDTVKQVSFQGLQGELQSYFESHLVGLQNQARHHLHKSYAGVHKMDTMAGVDAKLMDVTVGEEASHFPRPLLGCASPCGPGQFCDFQRDPPRCDSCTMCPPGFFLVSQCSPSADRICQDRDECLELPNVCGERVKCLNTPGGFRCLGVSLREAASGMCGHQYFYNQELQECQACSDCDDGDPVAIPCTATSDTICGSGGFVSDESRLSQAWGSGVSVPPARASSGAGHISQGLQLHLRSSSSSDTDLLLTNRDGRLAFLQHGLVWLDHNFALKHSCRNFLQVGMRLNGSQEDPQEQEGGRDLSGVRVEQPDAKYFQGVSVSAGAEVEPNHTLTLLLRSPNQHCNRSRDLHTYDLHGAPFSLLWLSHDTGAVAMTAQTTMSHHHHHHHPLQTSYRPAFRVTSVSDAYVVAPTHDGRGVRFAEPGVVKFVLQQALYAMGHACVREGFSLLAYVARNGTSREALRAFKTGVNYRDTSVTLSGAVAVEGGDALGFEVTSPPQCNVRYFADGTGISVLSLLWIPAAVSSAMTATVSRAGGGLPSGAVRNKPLLFQQTGAEGSRHVRLAPGGKDFVFGEEGTANVALNLKLIHSCNVVKVTLHRGGGGRGGGNGETGGWQAGPVAQQVSGHMPEGSEWASVGLRASFAVHNGTAVHVTLDCVRGRVNQIAHQGGGTNINILWVAL